MVLPRRRMAVTSKDVWTARSGLATTGSTAMALVGKKSHTAVRTSSRDQREMKGARWAMGRAHGARWATGQAQGAQALFTLGSVAVNFFLSLRFLREFYALTCCVGFLLAAWQCPVHKLFCLTGR